MRKWLLPVVMMTVAVVALLPACTDNDGGEDSNSNAASHDNADTENMATEEGQNLNDAERADNDGSRDDSAEEDRATANPESDRMVIYTADMTITIADFEQGQNDVQSLVEEVGGFIVNSSVFSSGEENHQEGKITARIPEENFDDFLDDVGEIADDVQDRSVNGEDVTKEYVDLESRLHAKEDVKKRLDNLLEEAEDTEDLLDISNKLGEIQEEIEELKGEMQYLENHSAMSTVNIMMTEENVKVGGVKDKEDLDTWEKTKKALVTSTNAIITFFSGLVIFLVGYSPILVPIIVAAAIVFWFYRRKKGSKNEG